jgi:glutamate-1-semialdehyde 2,1-aminomutase
MSYTAEALGTVSRSAEAFEQAFEGQRALFERAQRVLPGGAVHDSQALAPFQVLFERAMGAHKWAHGGRRLVDYWMGHGALLFGHGFAPVVEAVAAQLRQGTHLGAPSEMVVRWAELVCELIPSVEQVRFTSSGTEATLLAIRVARAFTGRQRILRFGGHFHGWHDEALAYVVDPKSGGLNLGAVGKVAIADPTDATSAVEFLSEEPVAAVILEPGGGSSGELPLDRAFLAELREGTRKHETLLIFDEVVSGFRYAPGGVQAMTGVVPDVTVLGKILSGGLPGAAIAASKAIMSVFGAGTRLGDRHARVLHTGTFNANPLAAAAGVATLERVGDGVAQAAARLAATRICEGVNERALAVGVDVRLYTNRTSIFHIAIGGRDAKEEKEKAPMALHRAHPKRYAALRRALLVEGVDSHPAHGWVSAVHDDEAISETVGAFDRAFERLTKDPDFTA